MSNVTFNLGLGATTGRQQASGADNDPGSSVADRVAAIMKKIGKLQKEAAALQGPPEEVAKMRKAIEQEIRALELKMEEMLRHAINSKPSLQRTQQAMMPRSLARQHPAGGPPGRESSLMRSSDRMWPVEPGTMMSERHLTSDISHSKSAA